MSPCIMALTTQDPCYLKEHNEHYKILKFRVNCANIEQDTAIHKQISAQVSGTPNGIHESKNWRVTSNSGEETTRR